MSHNIIKPPEKHRCTLPDAECLPLGTLAQCGECGRWSFLEWKGYTLANWYQVTWLDFKYRRRIKKFNREKESA